MTRTIPEAPGPQDMERVDLCAALRVEGDRLHGFRGEVYVADLMHKAALLLEQDAEAFEQTAPTPSPGDVESLIERLREISAYLRARLLVPASDTVTEAADKLAAITSHDTAILLRRYREALELFVSTAVITPETHRVSTDEFVLSKARAALKEGARK